MGYKTEQEEFWSGQFGNDYIERNKDNALFGTRINLWTKILERTKDVESVIEFGSNIGLNLKAMKIINPKMNFDLSLLLMDLQFYNAYSNLYLHLI